MIEDIKYLRLQEKLKEYRPLAIAFSGGVDSTFLLAVASKTIPGQVIAITVKSPYIPQWEVNEAKTIASNLGVEHHIIHLPIPGSIQNNPPDRCYLCKKIVFNEILAEAVKKGFHTVADGTNADDAGDYRPGMKALAELKINSPLLETGITKSDVRRFSASMGLSTHDKPAYACLLTRIPYNTGILQEDLLRIEKAEEFLINHGIRAVRVRHHGTLARIEADPVHFQKLIEESFRTELIKAMKDLGYQQVSLDLEGYRMGSFNESIKK